LRIARFIKENLFILLLIKNEDFKYKTRKFNGENNITVKKCTVVVNRKLYFLLNFGEIKW
jgi:hypothetical protein